MLALTNSTAPIDASSIADSVCRFIECMNVILEVVRERIHKSDLSRGRTPREMRKKAFGSGMCGGGSSIYMRPEGLSSVLDRVRGHLKAGGAGGCRR